MPTPDTIIFAVQAALKLGKAAQQAYVDSTRDRGLTLPTPEFDAEVNATIAANYFFHEDPTYRPPGLAEIMVKTDPESDAELTEEEQNKLVEFYFEARMSDPVARNFVSRATDGSFFTEESLKSMVAIRQWERGAPGLVTPLQRMAGTIVEIAVDYYASTPGAFNERSPQGKALRILLTALDGIEFSDVPIHDLPARLTVATIESFATHADSLSGDANTQELIKVTTTAIARDVKARIELIRVDRPMGNANKEQRIVEWAEVVFRSVLSSGSRLVVEDPKRFLGIDEEGTGALVNHVGVAALDFVLSQPEGSIDRVFGREGLDIVVRAALRAVGEHPEILTGTNNEGLKKLLSEVATELGRFDALVAPGTLPQVTRIILEKSGRNLPLIWPDKEDPRRNLLIASASRTLEILTRVQPDAAWQPTFGKEQLVELVDFALDEFVRNPGWLITAAGERSGSLEAAVEAVVDVLRTRADDRLSPETGLAVLRASLNAVAKRKKLLEPVPGGPLAVSALIDTAIGKIFDKSLDDAVTWAMVRHEVVTGVVESGLTALGKSDVGSDQIQALATTLDDQIANLADGDSLDLPALRSQIEHAIENA